MTKTHPTPGARPQRERRPGRASISKPIRGARVTVTNGRVSSLAERDDVAALDRVVSGVAQRSPNSDLPAVESGQAAEGGDEVLWGSTGGDPTPAQLGCVGQVVDRRAGPAYVDKTGNAGTGRERMALWRKRKPVQEPEQRKPRPVEQLVKLILLQGKRHQATRIDICLECGHPVVRYRLGGRDTVLMQLPLQLWEPILELLREQFPCEREPGVAGGWLVLEDDVVHEDEESDHYPLRFWFSATFLADGQSVRVVLHPSPEPGSLDALGTEGQLQEVLDIFVERGGLILLAGSPESGKSSTLHALIAHASLGRQPVLLLEARPSSPHTPACQPPLAHAAVSLDLVTAAGFRVIALDGLEAPNLMRRAFELSRAGHLVIATIETLEPNVDAVNERMELLLGTKLAWRAEDRFRIVFHDSRVVPCWFCTDPIDNDLNEDLTIWLDAHREGDGEGYEVCERCGGAGGHVVCMDSPGDAHSESTPDCQGGDSPRTYVTWKGCEACGGLGIALQGELGEEEDGAEPSLPNLTQDDQPGDDDEPSSGENKPSCSKCGGLGECVARRLWW